MRAYHGKSAILDFLLSVCGGVQAQGVKGELVHQTGLQHKHAMCDDCRVFIRLTTTQETFCTILAAEDRALQHYHQSLQGKWNIQLSLKASNADTLQWHATSNTGAFQQNMYLHIL